MKRILLLLAPLAMVLTAFVSIASASLSQVWVYSTVDYDSGTNMVSGYSYTTYPAGAGLYYQPQVTAQLSDASGNPLVWDFMETETGTARVELEAPGSGCQYYTIDGWHAEELYYYVTYYPPFGVESGYADPHYYSYFEEHPSTSYYITNVFEGFGPMRFREGAHIPLGSTTRSSSGTCNLPPIVSIGDFKVVGKGSSIDDYVSVFPQDNKEEITLTISSGGTGDARFPGNFLHLPISSSQLVNIQGVTESSAVDNLSITPTIEVLGITHNVGTSRTFSVAKVKISRTIGSQISEITNTTNNTIIGERFRLNAEVVPAGLTLANQAWNIPGNRVKEFFVTDQTRMPAIGHSNPVTGLSTNAVNFIWVDGNSNRDVYYSVAVGPFAYPIQGKATFNVQSPTTTLTASVPGTSVIVPSVPYKVLAFANSSFTQQGITITRGATTVPAPYGDGEFRYVQTVDAHITATYTNGRRPTNIYKIGLDGCHPYTSNDTIAKDNPDVGLDAPGFPVQDAEYNGHWKMYLMFKPSNVEADWVPLKLVDWRWDATAAFGTAGPFIAHGIVEPQSNTTISDTTDYPSWTYVVPDQSTTPPCQN